MFYTDWLFGKQDPRLDSEVLIGGLQAGFYPELTVIDGKITRGDDGEMYVFLKGDSNDFRHAVSYLKSTPPEIIEANDKSALMKAHPGDYFRVVFNRKTFLYKIEEDGVISTTPEHAKERFGKNLPFSIVDLGGRKAIIDDEWVQI